MQNLLRWLPALAAFALAGCEASITYTPLREGPAARTPRAWTEVEVFLSQRPDKPFTEIGMIESSLPYAGPGAAEQSTGLIAQMRVEAGRHGCDGVILTGANDTITGTPRTVATLKGYRGACIVYTKR